MTSSAVRAEQIRTLYQQSGPVLAANLLNAAIVSALLWTVGPQPALVVFLALMAFMTAGRMELACLYWRARPGPDDARRWGRRFAVGSGFAGLLWGTGAALFFADHSPLSQILMTFVIGGMGAGAAGTLACYLPAFVAFFVPSITPLVLRTFTFGDPLHVAMGCMIVVYGLGMIVVARTTHRSITQAFRLRFENDALVARLSESQASLQEVNRTLERRVAERSAALEKQGEALREAHRLEAVGRLAGGIAHDFNNLLTVVFADLAFLERDSPLDGSARDMVADIRNVAARGAGLIRQLLAFSRQQQLALRVLDLNEVVRNVQRLLEPIIGEQVEMKLSLGAGPLLVKADSGQIEQVIVNLATNARDAMPRGGTLSINTSLVEVDGNATMTRGSYVVLSVSDTGVGMDAVTRRRAFEPFFTTKEVGQGSGLGLATVYGVVDQSGGHVSVESEPGAGTEFKIYLPRAAEPPQEVEARPAPALAPGQATILLVEDEPGVRMVVERMLQSMGHEVLVAARGEEALEVWRAHAGRFDLLVTDVVMAGHPGPEVARLLTSESPGLRVLFISGYSAAETLPPSDPSRGVDYLPKPMTFEALAEKVSGLLAVMPAASPAV
jgi:signal transduction histidine kinase/ActR/RegA family two-component response regulator